MSNLPSGTITFPLHRYRRQRLDKQTLRNAFAEGEKMTIEEALDLALKTLDEI